MRKFRLAIASTALSAAAFAGPALSAAPASAAPVIAGPGLVNVAVGVEDVVISDLVDVNAAVPIGIAANVCGVNAAVLADQLNAGDVTCDIQQDQRATAALRQITRINQ